MKKLILSVILVGGISAGVHAQGLIDIFSTSASVFEVSGGHTNADPGANLGIELWGGSSASNLVVIAQLPNIGIGGGQFFDTSAGSDGVGDWAVPGVGAGGTGFFQVSAWVGPESTYPTGQTSDFTGSTGVFTVANLGSSTSPAPNLSGMPPLLLTVTATPEPTTLALCGLGAASLLLFRRKKK